MVSKATERSRTQTGYFLGANGIIEMIVNIEKSSFSGVMFTVLRLMRVTKIVTVSSRYSMILAER